MSNRRIRLGTFQDVDDPIQPEVSKRGWLLGSRFELASPGPAGETALRSRPQKLIRPQFMIVAALASIIFALAMISGTDKNIEGVQTRIPRVMADYESYLVSHKAALGDTTVKQRRNTARERLKRIADAEILKDFRKIRRESSFLLHLDNDAQSPIYRYSIELLIQFQKK